MSRARRSSFGGSLLADRMATLLESLVIATDVASDAREALVEQQMLGDTLAKIVQRSS